MEKILNSIEELYQLITGTLPEGCIEHRNKSIHLILGNTKLYGTRLEHAAYYFVIADTLSNDRFKIEYGKRGLQMVTDGRIYKYV